MNEEFIKPVKEIIFRFLDPHVYRAFIFGSRATNDGRKYSDIDIGIEGKPLSGSTLVKIQSAFEDSDLPFTVDVVDFTSVSDKFREVAKRQIITLN